VGGRVAVVVVEVLDEGGPPGAVEQDAQALQAAGRFLLEPAR
jgi:hypothetical protein